MIVAVLAVAACTVTRLACNLLRVFTGLLHFIMLIESARRRAMRFKVETVSKVSRRAALALSAALVGVGVGLGAARAEDKAAMLLPGSVNDQSWNAIGFAALNKLKAGGADVAYSENVSPADQIETMRDYARRGFSPVIGHSGRFLSAAQRIGPEFDKTWFLIASASQGAGKNVAAVDYNNIHIGYLMGTLAARMSKSGKVGVVAGLEGLPNVVQYVGGFRLGAKATKPDIEVKVIYIKDMEDAAMAKEAALSLISGGTDFVYGKLNAAQLGLIQAAKEKNIYTSGRSFAHVAAAPENVVTATIEDWETMYAAAAKAIKDGTIKPELAMYGFDSPAGSGANLKYSESKAFGPAVPAVIAEEVEAVKKKFASGALKVSVSREDARGGI
jgi:simple sugar transport system substrate-binding protein/basic membrane protein A